MTTILRCKCKHAFQDSQYGLGMRIANMLAKKDKAPVQHRCTVCGAIH